jgi:predicted HicB family RNase H-like nuclease
MPAPKSPPPKKASGANIEEWQRHGAKIQFRVSEKERSALEYLAGRKNLSLNEYAAAVLRESLGFLRDLPIR